MRDRGSSSLTPLILIISGLRECGTAVAVVFTSGARERGSSSLTPLTLIIYPLHCGSTGAREQQIYTRKKSARVF